jgi:hypothetical protein
MQQPAGSYALPQGHLYGIAGKRVGVYPRAGHGTAMAARGMIDRGTRRADEPPRRTAGTAARVA